MKAHFLSHFQGLGVLVIGDLILDHYLQGRVERISPEAPVPVVLHEQEDYRLGGAANVALNIQALGGRAYVVSALGQDEVGARMLRLLQAEGIETSGLCFWPEAESSLKTRIMARGQQLLRYDRERILQPSAEQEERLFEHCQRLLTEGDIRVLVFQDYNKGLLSPSLIRRLIVLCRDKNVYTVVDPKKQNFLAYEGVSLFKPNLKEINEGLGLNLSERQLDTQALRQAAERLEAHLGNRYTLITLGARGMYWHEASGQGFYQATRERQVADVCGAGDTVVSVAAMSLAAGLGAETLVTLANLAGGQVCERMGVVSVDAQALLKEYNV